MQIDCEDVLWTWYEKIALFVMKMLLIPISDFSQVS